MVMRVFKLLLAEGDSCTSPAGLLSALSSLGPAHCSDTVDGPNTKSLARAVEMGHRVELTRHIALRSIGRLAGAIMISN
jgi:hypothetical protein